MVLPDDKTTARQANDMPDGVLNNAFLPPGIRLSDLDTERAGQATSSLLSSSRRVGEWVGAEAKEVEMQDAQMKDAGGADDDSKRTATVQGSSPPDKVDRSDAAATAGSKRSAGDSEGSTTSWPSSTGKTDGSGATIEVARSKRSKISAGDSEDTVTSRAASSLSGVADGSLLTTRVGSKTSTSMVRSGSTPSASTTSSTSTGPGSQGISTVPAALDGPSEQRGSSSAGPSSNNNNNTNSTANNNKKTSSIHDLSAASYLARHQAKTAQNSVVIPGSLSQPAAVASAAPAAPAAASAASSSSLPPSIILSPPVEPSNKKQTIIYENRVLQNQLIETTSQQLWTRRENFLKFFVKTHNVTLAVDDEKNKSPTKGKSHDDDEDDDKRKDSFATSSSSSPSKTKSTTKTPQKPTLATAASTSKSPQNPPNPTPTTPSTPKTFADLLAVARQRALELLLEAWYEELGTRSTPSDGFTKYSEKTTTQAVLALRCILSAGDAALNIPIACLPAPRQAYWKHKLASVKFWFTSADGAVDFLAAFGVGDESTRFGSGVSRVEVLQYSLENTGGKCLSSEHHASERCWRAGVEHWAPNVFPPVRYCPCTEYKLLMKILAGAQRLPDPGSDKSVRWISHRMVRGWQEANLRAGVDVEKEGWPSEVGTRNLPLVVSFGGVAGFQMWHCFGRDEERGVLLRTIRLEGRFAELL